MKQQQPSPSSTSSFQIHQHLYQLYPNLPKYTNDPQQSQLIKTYYLILKRFQGIYNKQPKYFIRSPTSVPIFGSTASIAAVDMRLAYFSSLQNVIVCITENNNQKIRINHYQSALYGQKILESQSIKWRYEQKNDDYTNILIAVFKTFSSMYNIHSFKGMDLLIYDDYVHDDYIFGRQALCLGVFLGLQCMLLSRNVICSQMSGQFCFKVLSKINNLLNFIKPNCFPVLSAYDNITICNSLSNTTSSSTSSTTSSTTSQQPQQPRPTQIKFPTPTTILLAHSMTPLPKKMIQGKRQNLRTCQIRIGIEIIKNQISASRDIESLEQLRNYLGCTHEELLETVEEYVPKGGLSAEKIQEITQKSLIEILKLIPFSNNVIDQNLVYKPYNRIKFSLQQQIRINNLTTQNLLQTVKDSYKDGKQLLQIGSEQFDDMIKIVQQVCPTSALAYKIVGDGWGGYLLILCEQGKINQIIQQLINCFYLNEKNQVLLSDDIEQYVKVVGKPANGLGVLDPSSQIWFC